MDPKWLQGKRGYFGQVISFIPGQNDSDAAVVELEESITIDDITAKIVVLELRYVGAKWKSQETVHIELCDFIPEAKRWQERRKGKGKSILTGRAEALPLYSFALLGRAGSI